jgi:hypothetical protein
MAALPLLNMRALGQIAKPGTNDASVLEAQAFFRRGRGDQDNALDAPSIDTQNANDQDHSKRCSENPEY